MRKREAESERQDNGEGKGKSKMGHREGRASPPSLSTPVSLLVTEGGWTQGSPGPCWHRESMGPSREQREDKIYITDTDTDAGVPVSSPRRGAQGQEGLGMQKC